MSITRFPTIDMAATGRKIAALRRARGLSVRDLQDYFGFEGPQSIYKWQRGQSLPTVDNLFALSALLGVPMNDILVPAGAGPVQLHTATGQQADACCPPVFPLPPLYHRGPALSLYRWFN